MRSRISFFNKTVFRKDLTRFAPAWGIYTAGALLVIFTALSGEKPNDAGLALVNSLSGMALFNFLYAPVCALLLFGDQFSSRLCNALHAMPLKREGWFLTHVAAGMCFALVPYGAVTVCALTMLKWNWLMALVWLLGIMLQYLFFFSAAVLCAFCTGSRFAAGIFYGLVNFLALIVMFFVQEIYGPLISSITIRIPWIEEFTPVVKLMSRSDWDCWFDKQLRSEYGIGESWTYLLILTALVPGILAGALALYKKRRLECAGDFVVVKGVGPVFLLVYSLTVAVIFHLFGSIFMGNDNVGAFFIVGLAIGWFTGLMFLKRTVRVFRGKTILGFAIFAAVMLISFLLTWADPLGLTRWVPKAENVTSVRLDGSGHYADGIKVTDPADIAEITDIHSQAIEENLNIQTGVAPVDRVTFEVVFQYRLDSGKTASRTYLLDVESETVQRLVPYFSDPKAVLGYEDWEKFLDQLYQLRIDWDDDLVITGEDAVSLAQAIRADCEAGNMVQVYEFHTNEEGVYYGAVANVDIVAGDRHFDISIYHDCENTMQWFLERDLIPEHYLDGKYG